MTIFTDPAIYLRQGDHGLAFVCWQDNSENCRQIWMIFGGVRCVTINS